MLKGNQGGKALKWFPRPFQFWEKKCSKIKKRAVKHFEDWPPCSPIQRNGGRRSRPGANPFISALTVACCPATFPGVWPHFGTLCPQVGAKDEGRGLSYTCRRSLKTGRFFAHSHSQKFSLFSCRSKRGARSTAPRFLCQPRQQV
ncbi:MULTISPECIES: hypothetical protein [Bacteroides]|uniref:hypothetical protein n=1 Tax=Bacteroides TaxID=816 RepID=UPI001F304981|nr:MULTISPECIES: hypothetical protein [Bacteroides]MCE9137361.1 hypothetical protein [Bacteroides thetaiotaomicron]MCE9278247.1 hypothetical protein [Bacteroides thetaiotaomicron]MDC2371009.1 hypothetical protein [Bacteroides ovatus]MDC2386597.1 hypothetical protein [Bacteroides ovatus]